MPTDNRLKYFDSQIAELDSTDLVDSVTNDRASQISKESFEGGVHLGRARTFFLVFAAIIMILHVLDE